MIQDRINLADALLLVRTDSDTIIIPSVNGILRVETVIAEGRTHGQVGLIWEKDVDRIAHFELRIEGWAPGTVNVPHKRVQTAQTDKPKTEEN